MACFCINRKHMSFYNNILKGAVKTMKKNTNKKLLSKIIIIILGFLCLNNGVISMKPAKNCSSKHHGPTKIYPFITSSKSTEMHNPKKFNYHLERHNKLSYLNEPTIEETQKIIPFSSALHRKDHIYFYETENFKIIEIITPSGIIITKKIPKKSNPTYGLYKNDPYDESDEEWDNNTYVDKNPHLIDINNLFEFFRSIVINNENDVNVPKNKKYYAFLLTFSHAFYHNYPLPGYSIRVLDTNCLTKRLENVKKQILANQCYKEDGEKIDLKMIIMDNRIKLNKPLDLSKDVWSKRQKNLNFVIYVKKEFLQNLSPEEWNDIIFHIPLKMISLTN